MKVGSLVFDTTQGIGLLAKSFYDAGVVTDVMVVEHGRRPSNPDWYPSAFRIPDLRRGTCVQAMESFCQRFDSMLFFETPFRWELLDYCRGIGVKTALMVMYECEPKVLPALPDLFLCPSLLDLSYYPGVTEYEGVSEPNEAVVRMEKIRTTRSVFLPVPVEVPWRQRTRAEVFVHNAGNGGLRGRNGTKELLEAIYHVKSPARFIIRTQEPIGYGVDGQTKTFCPENVREGQTIEYRTGKTHPYDSLFQEGDVFVFPEKFNGLSLPLQEARAAGMLVMATDRFPMNTWLPRKPLIKVSAVCTSNVSPRCNDFEEAILDPRDIAAKIDEVYGTDISAYSLQGREWAETMSWRVLNPKYLEVLEQLCSTSSPRAT